MRMEIEIVMDQITRERLKELALQRFGDMVKAVIDIERRVMAVGGELHADEEQVLLDNGSKQQDLWGINLYPDMTDASWIEFDSMINLRPSQGNRSRSVDDEAIRRRIVEIVQLLTK